MLFLSTVIWVCAHTCRVSCVRNPVGLICAVGFLMRLMFKCRLPSVSTKHSASCHFVNVIEQNLSSPQLVITKLQLCQHRSMSDLLLLPRRQLFSPPGYASWFSRQEIGTWTRGIIPLSTLTLMECQPLFKHCGRMWQFQRSPVHWAYKFILGGRVPCCWMTRDYFSLSLSGTHGYSPRH